MVSVLLRLLLVRRWRRRHVLGLWLRRRGCRSLFCWSLYRRRALFFFFVHVPAEVAIGCEQATVGYGETIVFFFRHTHLSRSSRFLKLNASCRRGARG